MWRETRPIWTIIRYTSLAVILVVGGALLWLYINSLNVQPPPAAPLVILPTQTRATRIVIPPTAWETPTPRPRQPTWTPYGNPTGTDTLAPTGTTTATLSFTLTPTSATTLTRTPTVLMTRTKTKTTGPTRITSPTPTHNPILVNQTIIFGGLANKTYGASPFAVSATASSGLAVSFSTSGNCSNTGSTISITDAGSCTVTASQGGGSGYNPAADVLQSFTIYKAVASCSVTGYSVTYDTHPHKASGTCTGVFSEVLSGLDLTNTVHTNVSDDFSGDSWSYPGNADYNSASGPVSDTISMANGCNIVGWSGTYDGNSHGASGSCVGAGTLDLGASYTDVSGGSASWTYTGDANSDADFGAVMITINPANPNCSVNGYTVTGDGTTSFTATGSCTGPGNLDLNGTTHTDPGEWDDPWTFTSSSGNYTNDSGSVHDIIQ